MIIINTKGMINIIKSKMIKVTASQDRSLSQKKSGGQGGAAVNDNEFFISQARASPMSKGNPRQSVMRKESAN